MKTPPLSAAARLEAGWLLRRLHGGETLGMPHSRPMPSIRPRCHELRVVDAGKTWRIVYRLDVDALVIADVFQKTTAQRPARVIEEAALVEMRLALSRALRERRVEAGLTQAELARLTGSSQSRVAKMEAGDPSVSLDLLIRALLAAGASRREVGQALARRVACAGCGLTPKLSYSRMQPTRRAAPLPQPGCQRQRNVRWRVH